jgi:hypothetical protein
MGERCGRRLREAERGAGALSIVRGFDRAGMELVVDVREYLVVDRVTPGSTEMPRWIVRDVLHVDDIKPRANFYSTSQCNWGDGMSSKGFSM